MKKVIVLLLLTGGIVFSLACGSGSDRGNSSSGLGAKENSNTTSFSNPVSNSSGGDQVLLCKAFTNYESDPPKVAALNRACAIANGYGYPFYLESVETLSGSVSSSQETIRVTVKNDNGQGCGFECFEDFQTYMDSSGQWRLQGTNGILFAPFSPTAKSLSAEDAQEIQAMSAFNVHLSSTSAKFVGGWLEVIMSIVPLNESSPYRVLIKARLPDGRIQEFLQLPTSINPPGTIYFSDVDTTKGYWTLGGAEIDAQSVTIVSTQMTKPDTSNDCEQDSSLCHPIFGPEVAY